MLDLLQLKPSDKDKLASDDSRDMEISANPDLTLSALQGRNRLHILFDCVHEMHTFPLKSAMVLKKVDFAQKYPSSVFVPGGKNSTAVLSSGLVIEGIAVFWCDGLSLQPCQRCCWRLGQICQRNAVRYVRVMTSSFGPLRLCLLLSLLVVF